MRDTPTPCLENGPNNFEEGKQKCQSPGVGARK